MTKLTEERIKELWSGENNTRPILGVNKVLAFARAIEAELQPDFCDTHCTWRDHHPDCERAEPVQEPDVPFPGMQEEFEAYYSQSFTDRNWRVEAGVWAAAWKAATRYAALPDQTNKLDLIAATEATDKLNELCREQTAEIERLRNLSACEACAEIPSVMEYFKQCEERIATLEAEAERLGSAILKIRKELTGDIHSTNNLLDVIAAERYTKATLEAALREVLATRNEEASAEPAHENAKENFTSSFEEQERFEKAMIAASKAEKKARNALGEE